MIPIPEELIEQVKRGNVLLFIGERIVRDAQGRIILDQLTAQLAERCGIANVEALSFPEVAQAYQDDRGRQALIQFLRDKLGAVGDEPQPAHRLTAGLTDYCRVLITTSLSRLLERAIEETGRPLDTIVGNVDVAFEDESRVKLYKLRGSLDRPETLILTEDDHEAFFRNRANLSIVLQGYLARKTILFIGYDLADPLFKRLYFEVTAPLDDYARHAYAFGETPSPQVARWCRRHGIDVVEADASAFLAALSQELAARIQPAGVPPEPVAGPTTPLSELPYKLLDYYETKDAAIFFGRDQETGILSSLIHAHRLVLLHGASGVGKTSLLLAGVLPKLERAEPAYETMYIRTLQDPSLDIRRMLLRRLPEADLPEDAALVELLDTATKALGLTLILVFDQFEEFFMRQSPEVRAAFIAELGRLYDTRNLPVKLVLSLREDFLAAVSEIEARIPEVFHTRMRLLPLTRDQARQAIVAPVERLRVSYEPGLIERLLADLAGEGVMPPELQLVCSTLYDRLSPHDRQITLASYEELGGAAGILKEYLTGELARLGGPERALARSILKELIDSQGNKRIRTEQDLVRALGVPPASLRVVLEKLVRSHLVRPLDLQNGETGYELAHEYLISDIALWMSEQERVQRRAQEMLEQGLIKWRRFGLPLYRDEMAIVDAERGTLAIEDEAETLMVYSAVWSGYNADYWVEQASPQLRASVISAAMKSEDAVRRQRAAALMGRFAIRELAESLVGLMLTDSDPMVRREAALSLARIDRAGLVDRLQAVLEGSPQQQRLALEAIDNVQEAGLTEAEFGRLGSINLRWQLGQLRLQRNYRVWRTMALYGMFGGLAGAMLGGFWGTLYFGGGLVVTLGMAAAGIVGLLAGLGIGAGFGAVKAMQEPRSSIVYIISAMLGGAITGALAGMGAAETLEKFLSGTGLGLMGGAVSGVMVALIINFTPRIAPLIRRLVISSILALPAGAATSGAMLALVVQLRLAPPGVEPPYGFLVGVLSLVGIIVALELAEHHLDRLTQTQYKE